VSAQHAETPVPAPLPLRTIGDIRAALRSGHGFPGDQESFEADLQRALEASSETDPNAVATVIVDYRGRIHLYQDPDFDIAVQEGIDLTARLKQEANTRMLSDPKGFGGNVDRKSSGHDGRPPNCQVCTSMSAYRSGVRMARAVSGSGARTNAAVPSQVVPLSDSSGP
jgi:hypothetical protein